jgi:hypothetical protein
MTELIYDDLLADIAALATPPNQRNFFTRSAIHWRLYYAAPGSPAGAMIIVQGNAFQPIQAWLAVHLENGAVVSIAGALSAMTRPQFYLPGMLPDGSVGAATSIATAVAGWVKSGNDSGTIEPA